MEGRGQWKGNQGLSSSWVIRDTDPVMEGNQFFTIGIAVQRLVNPRLAVSSNGSITNVNRLEQWKYHQYQSSRAMEVPPMPIVPGNGSITNANHLVRPRGSSNGGITSVDYLVRHQGAELWEERYALPCQIMKWQIVLRHSSVVKGSWGWQLTVLCLKERSNNMELVTRVWGEYFTTTGRVTSIASTLVWRID